MSGFEKFIPAHIRALAPYTPGKPQRQAKRESGRDSVIKLASNENPYGPSPRAVEAIRRAVACGNFYPDTDSSELRQKLARLGNLAPEQVVVTAGSTQFLDIIARTLLSPGLNAVTAELTFIVYPLAVRAAGGELLRAPMRNDGFDLDAIAAAITPQTRIAFLANPNNPTGTMFDADALEAFLAKVPPHVLVVLDEAYSDFAEAFARKKQVTYSRSFDLVRQGRNVVVLRTFSKSHGLAGIRVGYGVGPPELMSYFARMKPAFSVSSVAEAAAIAALDDTDHVRNAVENNLRETRRLERELSALGFRVPPTNANFVFFDAAEDSAALARRLQAEGVIVRPLDLWGAPTGIRVTAGAPEQNRQFLAALKLVTEKAAAR